MIYWRAAGFFLSANFCWRFRVFRRNTHAPAHANMPRAIDKKVGAITYYGQDRCERTCESMGLGTYISEKFRAMKHPEHEKIETMSEHIDR